MIDILPYVRDILKPSGAQTELSENEFSATLPLITLTEVSNTAFAITEGKERLTKITIQLDMYDITPEKVRSLAGVVSLIMTEHGFRRQNGQFMKEDRLWRQMQEYSCIINNSTGLIYPGGNEI